MTEEQRAYSMDSLRRMVATLPTKRDLAWQELKNGVDYRWVAHKYEFDEARMLAAKKTLDERAAAAAVKAELNP